MSDDLYNKVVCRSFHATLLFAVRSSFSEPFIVICLAVHIHTDSIDFKILFNSN